MKAKPDRDDEPTRISRRIFDHGIELAYWRWERLWRDTTYQRKVNDLIALGAESFFSSPGRRWGQKRLSAFFLQQWGGVIPAPPPTDAEGRRLYDQVRKDYGLCVVVHYAVRIPVKDMAAFPIFVDTPERRPGVVDPDLVRQLAMEAYQKLSELPGNPLAELPGNPLEALNPDAIPELPERRLHKAIKKPKKRKVERTGFKGKRIHFDTLRRDLEVFDLRTSGLTLVGAAKRLGIPVETAKRAWVRAITLIPNHQIEQWDGSWMEAHSATCQECQPWHDGKRGAEPCPQMKRMLDPTPRRRRGERTVDPTEAFRGPEALDLLSARVAGSLPARSRRTK